MIDNELVYNLRRDLARYSCHSVRLIGQHLLGQQLSDTLDMCDLSWMLALKLSSTKNTHSNMNGSDDDNDGSRRKRTSKRQLQHQSALPRKRMKEPDYFSNMPLETLFEIALQFDDINDLIALCRTQRAFNDNICQNSSFLKQRLRVKDNFRVTEQQWNEYCTKSGEHGMRAYLQVSSALKFLRKSLSDAITNLYDEIAAAQRYQQAYGHTIPQLQQNVEELQQLLSQDWTVNELLNINYMRNGILWNKESLNTFFVLVYFGADPNKVDEDGNNVLQRISTILRTRDLNSSHIHIIEKLIDAGVNINARNHDGNLFLHSAIQSGLLHDLEFFDYVLRITSDNINTKNNDGNTPLHLFATHFTATDDMIGIVKRFLQNQHIDINAQNNRGDTALHLAVSIYYGFFVIKFLYSYKYMTPNATITNNRGNTPVHTAATREFYREFSQLVLPTIIDPTNNPFNIQNNRGQTPLHIAAIEGEPGGINTSLLCGADIDIQDNDGNTPLHLFILQHEDVSGRMAKYVIKLAKKSINLNLQNRSGQTILDAAIQNGYNEKVINALQRLINGEEIYTSDSDDNNSGDDSDGDGDDSDGDDNVIVIDSDGDDNVIVIDSDSD